MEAEDEDNKINKVLVKIKAIKIKIVKTIIKVVRLPERDLDTAQTLHIVAVTSISFMVTKVTFVQLH